MHLCQLLFIGDAELAGDLLEIAGLLLYDRISSRVPTPHRAPQTDAAQRAREVEEILREAEHSAVRNIDRADLRELHELLVQPHMRVSTL
ncbi:hypothetical protein X777_08619 [Ooceraea biroi]|uniref:Uncharacterized protein n=1 Tax=Ooceraea biroi TaxID=2015173 RepID=A0A026X3G9_OOCBI|nr:hypothetical protein X777_08619 [Ooceraea biroi]